MSTRKIRKKRSSANKSRKSSTAAKRGAGKTRVRGRR